MSSHHTRSKPIPLLSLSLSNYKQHCRPIALISHGLSLAKIVPNWTVYGVSINPGPFTIKEHVLVIIMVTVGYGPPCAVCAPLSTCKFRLNLPIDRYGGCSESLL